MGGAVFTPLTRNWQWFQDDGAEPTSSYQSENTEYSGSGVAVTIFRLRWNWAETAGKAAANQALAFEYSTDQSSWNTPGASAAWNYGAGQGTHGNTVTSLKLSDTVDSGEYITTTGGQFSFTASSDNEFDLAITPGSTISSGTRYYFRAVIGGTGRAAAGGETFPSIVLTIISPSPTPTPTKTSTPSLTITPSLPDPWYNNVRACYDFEEASGTIFDQSYNSNDLATNNLVTYQETGKLSNCVGYLSSTSYSEGGSGLNGYVDKLSISAWFKFNGTGTSASIRTIFSKRSFSGTAYGYQIIVTSGSNYVNFGIHWTGGLYSTTNESVSVTDGNWHHVVATYEKITDSLSYIHVYVDNVDYANTISNAILSGNTTNYRLGNGSAAGGGANSLMGWLDTLTFWGDRALSSGDVSLLWNSGAGSVCNVTAPTPSITPSLSISRTQTPSLSISRTQTPSLSISRTPSVTRTQTPSLSLSGVVTTPSSTPSLSVSQTPSLSISQTPSITPTTTPSLSISQTPSITRTPSLSISKTPSLTPSTSPIVPPWDTAIACWDMEDDYGTLTDSVSSLVLVYSATTANLISHHQPGKISDGLLKDSVQEATYWNSSTDIFVQTNTFSFSGWFKMVSGSTNSGSSFFYIRDLGGNYIKLSPIHGQTYLQFSITGGNFDNLTVPFTLNDMTWHHIVFTLSGQTSNTYIDNSLLGSSPFVHDVLWEPNGSPSSFEIFQGGTGHEYFDQFSFWDTILSPEQVNLLYAGGVGRTCIGEITSPTPTPSQTKTPTVTPTNTPSLSISATRTPSITPTLSISETPSRTPSITPSLPSDPYLNGCLKAYWNLNETSGSIAYDSWNGYNSIEGDPHTINETGISGTAYSFSGSDVLRFLPVNEGDFYTQASGYCAVSAWIYITSDKGLNQSNHIWGNDSSGPYFMLYGSGSLQYRMYWGDSQNHFGDTLTYSLNTWYHVMAIKSENRVEFYRNGTSAGVSTVTTNSTTAVNITIGNGAAYNTNFAGRLDEMAFWIGCTLNSTDAAYLYNNGNGYFYVAPTPTPTQTPSTTPTQTPSLSISQTPSLSISATPSLSISLTQTPSLSISSSPGVPSPSSTPSLSISATPSLSISATQTPSTTPSRTPSLSISTTPSLSISATPSLSISITPSLSISPTQTPSLSVSSSPGVPSSSPTPSLSISATPSLSISRTPSLSISATRTPSLTPSRTPSLSISVTPSLSISLTPSLSISATRTPSLTPSPSFGAVYSHNVVKYTTIDLPNTVRLGNIAFGLHGAQDWGRTIDTDFWNGFDPPTNGYTIYRLTASRTEPSIVIAHNDAEAIYFAKSYGGTDINTIGEALNYLLTGSTDTTVVNLTYPDIVMDSLIFNIDAGYTVSYPRSGAIWKDVSGNAYDATFNSLSYDSSDGGVLNFSSHFGVTTSTPFTANNDFTIGIFAKSSTWMEGHGIISNKNYWTTGQGVAIGNISSPQTVVGYVTTGSAHCYVNSNIGTPYGWTYIVLRRSGSSLQFYINAVARGGDGINTISGTVTDQFDYFGIGDYIGVGSAWNGTLGMIHIHQRALSDTEITQNYDALKGRFGL